LAKGTKELHFEEHISEYLSAPEQGWELVFNPENYNKEHCLLSDVFFRFLKDTQPEIFEELEKQYGEQTERHILQHIAQNISSRGVMRALREKIKDRGQELTLYYPQPANSKNPDHERLYRKNIFTVVQQLHYSEKNENSIDLVLFINGIPIVTAEVKNALTGQYLNDAIRQYKYDRDPKEPLFQWKRCLVHFAVSTEKVSMTTKLAGEKTYFLPFNLDIDNPPNTTDNSFSTEYLWKEVWHKDSLLELIQHFVHEQTDSEKYFDNYTNSIKEKKSEKVIFPRFHQRRAVRSLLEAVRENTVGTNYLIEHSAGSGKSNTISWLTHRLSSFYRNSDDDKRMFDSVIVVTDRKILDRQLQNNIMQFEQVSGVVETIDDKKTSVDLKNAIEAGKSIIVTTLQKFPVISDEITRFADRKYAVIIDEAHSSQSGKASKHLKKSLSLEQAEKEDEEEKSTDELVLEEISKKGRLKNVSFFAFTATPKNKTLQLFGTIRNETFEAFDKYSMEQAITEGFILDVLQNYTTFKRYYRLAKRPQIDDKEYEIRKTVRLLNSYVDLLDHAIETKARIMLEHFVTKTQTQIQGRARAMLVTRSRLHAVRFKRKFDELMREMNLPYNALVAFSGTVYDKDTDEYYTETSMNNLGGKISIEDAFKTPGFRILIAANKFQTGFDEPLLQTMFVDKKLGDVSTVQTLSRLNRMSPGKTDAFILDFVNDIEQVQKDFQKYYNATFMSEENQTDPNSLYTVLNLITKHHLYSKKDLNRFAEIFFKEKANMEQLQPLLEASVLLYNQIEKTQKVQIKSSIIDYIRLYDFLSQIITFSDVDLEKHYIFVSHLIKKLPKDMKRLAVEVTNEVLLDSYKVQKQYTEKIKLESRRGELKGIKPSAVAEPSLAAYDLLSQIIKTLNDLYGVNLTEEDKVELEKIQTELFTNDELMSFFNENNSKQNIKDKFFQEMDNTLLQFVNSRIELYNKLTEDKVNDKLKSLWFNHIYDQRLRGMGKAGQ
jgi:type I restriction enzyme R subunit